MSILMMMLLLFFIPFFQLIHGLDVSNFVPNVSIKKAFCKNCKTLVESFEKGIERTKNDNFGGGNTAWEEEHLLVYANSDIRFIDIYEKLCTDIKIDQNECFDFKEKYEIDLEDWWRDGHKGDLYNWLCINKIKVCCPEKHYGSNCLPCKGYPNVCNLHGTCKGDGTRKGNGQCICNSGYDGDNCDRCAKNYYTIMKNETLACKKCHKSCKEGCIDSGPKGCNDCNDGWIYMGEGKGCVDINECLEQDVCTTQQFCVNNDGSYSCLNCDPACKDCYGDGNDMCYNCAPGYIIKDKRCIDTTEDYDVEEKTDKHRMEEL